MQKSIPSTFYNESWATNNPFWVYGDNIQGKRRSEGIAPYLIMDTFDVWNKPVLDVGCGKGYLCQFLKEYGANIIGLDYSQYSVDNKVCDRVMLGDMTDLSQFKDNTFDLVISRENFEHLTLEQCEKAFKEMVRVTNKYIYMTIWLETRPDAKDDVVYDDFKNDKSHITVCSRKFWENWFQPYIDGGIIVRDKEKEDKLDWKRKGRVWVWKKL